MTATIKWSIQQLDRKTADGFVTTAHWRCNVTDGEYSVGTYGSAGFTGNLTIPYEDLTQEQVLGWVWGSVDKNNTETNLLNQIEFQKNPVTVTGTPWSAA
jgi:hypothetical protein